MNLSTKTLILAAAAAIVAVGCADTAVVATVDETAIDEESVTELRYSYAESATYDGEFFRGDLTNLIYLEAQKTAAEQQFGLTGLDDPELIEAKIANPTENEAAVFANVISDPDRTEATREAVAEQLVIRDAVVAELVDRVDALEQEMLAAAEALEFERAASLRDRVMQLKENIGKPLSEVEIDQPSSGPAGRQKKRRKGVKRSGRSQVPRPKRG